MFAVSVSVLLLLLGNLQHPLGSNEYTYGTPAERICMALNSPALLIRTSGLELFQAVGIPYSFVMDRVFLIMGIGLLWSAVAQEIQARFGNRVLSKNRRILSGFLRILAVLAGPALFLLASQSWNRLHRYSFKVAVTETGLEIAWAIILVLYAIWPTGGPGKDSN